MATLIHCIVDRKGKLIKLDQNCYQLRDKVNSLLLNYSKANMNILDESQEFKQIILYFLSLPDLFTLLKRNNEAPCVLRSYSKHINKLQQYLG